MLKKALIVSSVIGLSLLSGIYIWHPTVFGATASNTSITSNGNGYRISPVRTSLTVNPGASASVQVYITNISTSPENLAVVIDDFQAKNETGTPALLINGQSLPKHGLKQYASLPVDTVALNPGETKSLFANIAIPKNAVPGGYYGAVRFSPTGPGGDRNVNLAASVASLMLVKVPGNIYENVTIDGFGASQNNQASSIFFNNSNLSAFVKFKNNGDIQEAPFGKILLKKGGATLSSYEINNTTPPGNVLPDSIRKFSVNLHGVGTFGKYTLEGNFGYGTNGQLVSATSTFYVIPIWMVIGIILLIIIIVLAIIYVPRMIRRHDRRIIRRARRGR